MVYLDLWGKACKCGIRGEFYTILFTDAATALSKGRRSTTRRTSLSSMLSRSTSPTYIETRTGRKPRRFRFGGGREYLNDKVIQQLES